MSISDFVVRAGGYQQLLRPVRITGRRRTKRVVVEREAPL